MWVNDNIYLIDTRWGGYREAIASYLVRGEEGFILIDTGYGESIGNLLSSIRGCGLDIDKLKYIIVTHTHLDHMGASGLILRDRPGVKVLALDAGVINLTRPRRLVIGARMVFGDDLRIGFGEVVDTPRESIMVVEDGDVIKLDGLRLRIIETPGHTRDHISIYEEETGSLITGDAVCNRYPGFNALIPPASPPSYPVSQVVESIRKISRLDIKYLLTPHYGPIEDVDGFLGDNINTVVEWKDFIISNLMKGDTYRDVIGKIRRRLLDEAGIGRGELPPYVRDIVLPILLRVSVLGYMATYINRFPPET